MTSLRQHAQDDHPTTCGGLRWTNTGFLIQLNGTNGLAPITIYASTNLSSWIPIYSNVPTNGPILFLDTAATNYRARFYHIFEQ